MKTNFYKYVTETYKNEQSPKGDFARDMINDNEMPKYKANKKVFQYLDYMKTREMCCDAAEIYDELKLEYLGKDALSYFIRDNYEEIYSINNNLGDIEEESLDGDFAYKITDKDIDKLKNGKILLIQPNDEYTCFIKYEKERDENYDNN